MCPIRNIEICQLVHLQQRVTCTPWNRRRVPTLVFCVGMGWERFPVIRTFPARDVSLVQSQYNKLTLDHDNDIPRLIKQWLKLLFNKLAIDGFCCLSSLIDYLKEHNTDFLTSSQRQIYVEEGIFRIENDMQWLTFEQLIYLLTHQVRNGRETSLPNPLPPPQQTQPRQFLTYKVPTTQELLPLFPRLAIDDSFKSRIEQNLQAANQISAQLSSRCDESICERIESMMQESSIKKRSDYDSDEEDMEIVGENLALKLLACRRKPLSLEEEAAVDSALKPPYDNTILCEKFKIPISRSKMSCLRPVTWLNDEVINFYLEMLAERDALLCQTPNTTRLPSHYFNTFFISKLLERGVFTYSNVRRFA